MGVNYSIALSSSWNNGAIKEKGILENVDDNRRGHLYGRGGFRTPTSADDDVG